MARQITVELKWEGPRTASDTFENKAGVYMVISGRKNSQGKWATGTYEIVDIGQTGEAKDRLAGHERRTCWGEQCGEDDTILFKFAPMSSQDYDQADRVIVECCLRAHNAPLPCGEECNSGYAREDSVTIANTGAKSPLHSAYSCEP